MIAYWNIYHEKLLLVTMRYPISGNDTDDRHPHRRRSHSDVHARSERVMNGLIYLFSLLYSIPSLALFAILIPPDWSGGKNTAIIVLVIYC